MNALAHSFVPAADPRDAMARDHLGRPADAAEGPVTYHTSLSALDTRGPLSLVDSTSPAGLLVPGHVHADEDEVVIVLSGVVEIRLVDRVLRRGPGTTAFIPRGAEHAVRMMTEARTIAILTREGLGVPAA